MSEADEQARRLAEALRANLRRRKEQARGRDAASEPTTETVPPPADPLKAAP